MNTSWVKYLEVVGLVFKVSIKLSFMFEKYYIFNPTIINNLFSSLLKISNNF